MAILKIARMGHPVLLRRAEPVPDPAAPEVQRLIRDMIETMEDAGGAGLAARPGWGAYAASKFALRAFADALRGFARSATGIVKVRTPST